MASNATKTIMGATYDTATEARAQAQVLGQQGMKVRIFGPARRARIQGSGSEALQWPSGSTTDRYLVIGTNGDVETPPGSAG